MTVPSYEKWVETYFEYEWWDFVFEEFTHQCQNIGIHVEQIYFSLSYCQSDYALFEGYIDDWALFIKEYPSRSLLIDTACLEQVVSYIWKMTNQNNLVSELELHDGYDYEPYPVISDGVCAGMTLNTVMSMIDESTGWENQDKDWYSIGKDLSNDLYRMLRKEYEALTSEENYNAWVKENGADYETK